MYDTENRNYQEDLSWKAAESSLGDSMIFNRLDLRNAVVISRTETHSSNTHSQCTGGENLVNGLPGL